MIVRHPLTRNEITTDAGIAWIKNKEDNNSVKATYHGISYQAGVYNARLRLDPDAECQHRVDNFTEYASMLQSLIDDGHEDITVTEALAIKGIQWSYRD